MNKTRIFILLALLVCIIIWFVPAAQASQCGTLKPSKYMPTFTLVTPPSIEDLDFDVQQGNHTIDIRNVSSKALYLLVPRESDREPLPLEISKVISSETTISYKIMNDNVHDCGYGGLCNSRGTGVKNFSFINGEFIIINSVSSVSCDQDGGVADDQPVPLPRVVPLVLFYDEQLITIPVIIVYLVDPNYESRLNFYNETGRGFRELEKLMYMILICGATLIIVGLFFLVVVIKRILIVIDRRHEDKINTIINRHRENRDL